MGSRSRSTPGERCRRFPGLLLRIQRHHPELRQQLGRRYSQDCDSGANKAASGASAGTAMFTAANLKPGSTGAKCITVTSSGSLASTVKLYATDAKTTKQLSSSIDLVITEGTGGDSSCTGFAPAGVIFTDTLAKLGSKKSFAAGVGPGPPVALARNSHLQNCLHAEQRGTEQHSGWHRVHGLHLGSTEQLSRCPDRADSPRRPGTLLPGPPAATSAGPRTAPAPTGLVLVGPRTARTRGVRLGHIPRPTNTCGSHVAGDSACHRSGASRRQPGLAGIGVVRLTVSLAWHGRSCSPSSECWRGRCSPSPWDGNPPR